MLAMLPTPPERALHGRNWVALLSGLRVSLDMHYHNGLECPVRFTMLFPSLVLEVPSRSENRDRSASIVKSGIGNKLVIERAVKALEDPAIVVCFQSPLRGVIQRAVAVQDSEPPGGKVLLVNLGDAAYHPGHANRIIGAMPGLTLDTDAQRSGVIHVSKHPCFVLSVIPAQA